MATRTASGRAAASGPSPWRWGLVAAAVAVALAGCGVSSAPEGTAVPSPEPVPASPEAYAAALVEETNLARTGEGLPALTVSICAQDQGAQRAQALADAGTELVHAPMAPVAQACGPVSVSGENLSRASLGPAAVVDAWMQSPGHRENILTPEFTQMGIACVPSGAGEDEQTLCSQIFLG